MLQLSLVFEHIPLHCKYSPEQTLGSGLRRMYPNNAGEEYVSVVGTEAFMDFVESIQTEGR